MSNPSNKDGAEIIERLYRLIESRKGGDPDKSYVAKRFAKGTAKLAEKMGEEAVETVIAAVLKDKREVARESADLLFHLLILWADAGIEPSDVFAELATREGTSGIDEKKNRKK